MQDNNLDWLLDEILAGLQNLIVLNLPNTPPSETIALTAKVWFRALAKKNTAWDFEQDCWRIEAGFDALLPIVRRWPAPYELLEAMPPRPEPDYKLLAAPTQLTEEQKNTRSHWLQKIKDQIKDFGKRHSMPEPRPEDYAKDGL